MREHGDTDKRRMIPDFEDFSHLALDQCQRSQDEIL